MLLQLKTSEEQIALCHVFWHLDIVPLCAPDLKQIPRHFFIGNAVQEEYHKTKLVHNKFRPHYKHQNYFYINPALLSVFSDKTVLRTNIHSIENTTEAAKGLYPHIMSWKGIVWSYHTIV